MRHMRVRVRDTQRKKVYTAERVLDDYATPTPTVKDVERLVRRIEKSKTVQKHFPQRASRYVLTRVADGRGRRKACSKGGVIAIPLWARSDRVVLHEMAHELVNWGPRPTAGHGWEFCQAYLFLVRKFMSKEAHDALKKSFKEHKVRIRPKRSAALMSRGPVSEEHKQKLRERLAAAREAKKLKQQAATP